ncbi:PLP-dependent aminotransferase family protein [Nicoliella spurrieriana]|uniref:PLP-dependent aminotransferase family protein n=1 Tax=Nicoliella spurrieriana TaxID=2925830 RepID=A0A976RT85_9LACO|nr:PLP-dependent aminotransferase family protein [Nicoliella spurrieriana]UQS87401.1 PLP-dependent aminotransferase family protein [Nicoliella spurrieriana]
MTKYNFSSRVPLTNDNPFGEILTVASKPSIVSFAGGLPAPELFPVAEIQAAANRVFDEAGQTVLQYSLAQGNLQLRQLISQYMQTRGLNDAPDDLLITTGSQQGLDLIAEMMVNPGDVVISEKPTYLSALDVFKTYGAETVGVDMDADGMKMDELEATLKRHPNTKLVYVVPNFQNPTGNSMSLARRQRLVALAEQYDFLIIEDDPYGAIRYAGDPIAPIKSLDSNGRVLYTGTFSKILAPGLRLGWISAASELITKLTLLKQFEDVHSDNLTQAIIAQYMQDNDMQKHIDHITSNYRDRGETMHAAIEKYFPAGTELTHPEGGMFLWVKLPGNPDIDQLFAECIKNNVAFVPGAPFFPDNPETNTMRMNFSNRSVAEIESGIKKMGAVISSLIYAK